MKPKTRKVRAGKYEVTHNNRIYTVENLSLYGGAIPSCEWEIYDTTNDEYIGTAKTLRYAVVIICRQD